jgi:hypothetical protein
LGGPETLPSGGVDDDKQVIQELGIISHPGALFPKSLVLIFE